MNLTEYATHRWYRFKLWCLRLVKTQQTCDHCDTSAIGSDLKRNKYWCWDHEPSMYEVMGMRFTDLSDYEWKWKYE